ncbi:Leishmanolysin-like peptidase [Schistosoma japonicum]|uniref:Leishmanolysin-like peptidase n=1 Tax=Schistosoma japonicum TaxID=6182 RepID=A0A4Z2D8L5_SCHJA|nr:Leishmanolysin-like peptidase [Schistosoma japonicum]
MINCLNNSGFYHLQMKITVHVFLCIVVLNSVITEYVNTAIVENKSTVHKKPLEKRKLNIIISYDESIKKRREFQEIKEAVESSSKYWKEALVVKIYQMGNSKIPRKCLSTQIRLSYLTNQFYCVNDYCSEEVKCNGMKIPDNYLSVLSFYFLHYTFTINNDTNVLLGCYNKKNGEYTLAFNEGSGLAENDLLLLVGNHDEQSTNPEELVTPKICGFHNATKRCLVGALHYNLFGNKLAGISSHQLLILTKRALGYLLKEARKHFDCNELQGIELQGEFLSHRIMGNDLMTPYLLESHVMSRITLAYFEDTNLYDVNYKKAENFTWGKDLGCNFLMESCHEYIPKRKADGRDIQPFCDNPNERKCLNYENAVGVCYYSNFRQQILSSNQHMNNSFINPANRYTLLFRKLLVYDNCPLLVAYKNQHNQSSVCRFNRTFQSDLVSDILPEETGPQSACFDYDLIRQVNSSNTNVHSKTASCHRYKCSKELVCKLESVDKLLLAQ